MGNGQIWIWHASCVFTFNAASLAMRVQCNTPRQAQVKVPALAPAFCNSRDLLIKMHTRSRYTELSSMHIIVSAWHLDCLTKCKLKRGMRHWRSWLESGVTRGWDDWQPPSQPYATPSKTHLRISMAVKI